MYPHLTGILANQVYRDYGSQYSGEYSEFCELIRDEYEDLFDHNHDIPLSNMDDDDIEEILDQAYMEYMQICP